MACALLPEAIPRISNERLTIIDLNESHYPKDKNKSSLLIGGTEIDEINWYQTKEFLRKTFKGRRVVEWVEQNLETSSK